VTSCVVAHVEEPMDRGAPRSKTPGEVEQIVVDVLQDLAPLGGDSRVAVSDVIEEASLRLPHDPKKRDQRRARAKRALESLQCKSILQIEADMVVLTLARKESRRKSEGGLASWCRCKSYRRQRCRGCVA